MEWRIVQPDGHDQFAIPVHYKWHRFFPPAIYALTGLPESTALFPRVLRPRKKLIHGEPTKCGLHMISRPSPRENNECASVVPQHRSRRWTQPHLRTTGCRSDGFLTGADVPSRPSLLVHFIQSAKSSVKSKQRRISSLQPAFPRRLDLRPPEFGGGSNFSTTRSTHLPLHWLLQLQTFLLRPSQFLSRTNFTTSRSRHLALW